MIFPAWEGSLAVVAIDVVVGVVVAVNIVVVVVFVPASTLRGSYGRLDQGAHSGAWHFPCKFPHTVALMKSPCAFRFCRLAQNLRREFCLPLPVNVRVKWLL